MAVGDEITTPAVIAAVKRRLTADGTTDYRSMFVRDHGAVCEHVPAAFKDAGCTQELQVEFDRGDKHYVGIAQVNKDLSKIWWRSGGAPFVDKTQEVSLIDLPPCLDPIGAVKKAYASHKNVTVVESRNTSYQSDATHKSRLIGVWVTYNDADGVVHKDEVFVTAACKVVQSVVTADGKTITSDTEQQTGEKLRADPCALDDETVAGKAADQLIAAPNVFMGADTFSSPLPDLSYTFRLRWDDPRTGRQYARFVKVNPDCSLGWAFSGSGTDIGAGEHGVTTPTPTTPTPTTPTPTALGDWLRENWWLLAIIGGGVLVVVAAIILARQQQARQRMLMAMMAQGGAK